MKFFRDVSRLHQHLRDWEKFGDARRALLIQVLEAWEFTSAQASLCTSIVLGKNADGSADWVTTNGSRVTGSWVRGEQQGNVGGWLSTMKETWQFDHDLTYTHKIERYESSISTGPFFQSSYSRPTMNVEGGIWAPPVTMLDQLELFVMSYNGFARSVKLKWIENEKYNYRACSIDGKRFSRE
jgi:hypothetical protein